VWLDVFLDLATHLDRPYGEPPTGWILIGAKVQACCTLERELSPMVVTPVPAQLSVLQAPLSTVDVAMRHGEDVVNVQ